MFKIQTKHPSWKYELKLDSKILKFGQFGKTDILYMETNSGGLKDILLNQTFKHDNSTLSSE